MTTAPDAPTTTDAPTPNEGGNVWSSAAHPRVRITGGRDAGSIGRLLTSPFDLPYPNRGRCAVRVLLAPYGNTRTVFAEHVAVVR